MYNHPPIDSTDIQSVCPGVYKALTDTHVAYIAMLNGVTSSAMVTGHWLLPIDIEIMLDAFLEGIADCWKHEETVARQHGFDIDRYPANYKEAIQAASDCMKDALIGKFKANRPQAGWRENADLEEMGQP